MELEWLDAEVELVEGYLLATPSGPVQRVPRARVALQGGFVHVDVPGNVGLQVVSAPAVRRLVYQQG